MNYIKNVTFFSVHVMSSQAGSKTHSCMRSLSKERELTYMKMYIKTIWQGESRSSSYTEQRGQKGKELMVCGEKVEIKTQMVWDSCVEESHQNPTEASDGDWVRSLL